MFPNNNMFSYILSPIDTLFIRDARPMQARAGSGGHGANWPMPTLIHKAFRSALLIETRTLPLDQNEPIVHHKRRQNGHKETKVATDLFRSLRTIGPFPFVDDNLYLPLPSDVVLYEGNGHKQCGFMSPSLEPKCPSNLPAKWLFPVVSPFPPTKTILPQWVSIDWFKQYLYAGSTMEPPVTPDLFITEYRIGIKIDDTTHNASESQIYTAGHLRLSNKAKIWFSAYLNTTDKLGIVDNFSLEEFSGKCIAVGGESRLCKCHKLDGYLLKKLEDVNVPCTRVKWTLVLPACFINGWLPNWIDNNTGKVNLKKGNIERQPNEDRLSWRKRIREMPTIKAKLLSARIPKPIFASGWKVAGTNDTIGPKPTQLFVPAGSVYYFEADSVDDAKALIKALHGRTLSDRFGETGMGLGFCSTWSPFKSKL